MTKTIEMVYDGRKRRWVMLIDDCIDELDGWWTAAVIAFAVLTLLYTVLMGPERKRLSHPSEWVF